MSEKVEITCKCGCGRKKQVKRADIDRGWGLFYSKSCKANYQEDTKRVLSKLHGRKYHMYMKGLL